MPTNSKEYMREYMRKYRRENNYNKYMRRYRARRKEKIAELKRLASQPITLTSALELAEKIKEL